MHTINRLVYLVLALSLIGCQPHDHDAETLRGEEFEISDGEVIRYVVHDQAPQGRPPATVILLRYHRGGPDAPKFDWECRKTTEGDEQFRVGKTVVNETKGIQFFFNARDGSLQKLELHWYLLEDVFQRDTKPSKEELCKF